MKKTNLAIAALLLSFGFAASVQAGVCCQGHGGEKKGACNKSTQATGYKMMCTDGTMSPSCICEAKKKKDEDKVAKKAAKDEMKAKKDADKAAKKTEKKATKATKTTAEPSTTKSTKPATEKKGSWWHFGGKGDKSGSSTTTPAASGSACTKGCCSSHGGLKHECSTSHKQMCKDGTESPTCECPCK